MASKHRLLSTAERKPDIPQDLASGDCTSFWQYWLCHYNEFLTVCARWLGGNRQTAQDVVSTGAVKVIDHLYGRTVAIQNFRAWLFRVLRNLCMDVQRTRLRTICLQLSDSHESDDSPVLDSLVSGERPDRLLYRSLLRRTLNDSVQGLPIAIREVFWLRFVEELPYGEISLRVGITAANARKRVQQARSILQDRLEAPG